MTRTSREDLIALKSRVDIPLPHHTVQYQALGVKIYCVSNPATNHLATLRLAAERSSLFWSASIAMRPLASVLLGVCFCMVGIAHAIEFGVGFGLNIDYGVASVYFRNGSTFNIAKIEGTPAYKATMKMAPHIHAYEQATYTDYMDSDVLMDRSKCDCYQAYKPPGSKAASEPKGYLRMIQEYLPSWTGGPAPAAMEAGAQSLTDMLAVLKLATETYLGAEVTNATVAVPFPVGMGRVDCEALEVRLQAAASALHIKLSPPQEILGLVGSQDRNWHRRKRSPYTYFSCHPDEDLLSLGVDFSNAALTATVQAWDCGDSRTARILHSTKLGAHELFATDDWRARLVDALRAVTALPVSGTEFSRTEEIDHFSRLILVGERARDSRLHEALRDVFNDHYEALNASTRDDGSPAQDPVFLGAARGAHWNWEYYQYQHYFEWSCTGTGPDFANRPNLRYVLKGIRHVIREWFRSTEDKKVEMLAKQKQDQKMKERAQYPLMLGPP